MAKFNKTTRKALISGFDSALTGAYEMMNNSTTLEDLYNAENAFDGVRYAMSAMMNYVDEETQEELAHLDEVMNNIFQDIRDIQTRKIKKIKKI